MSLIRNDLEKRLAEMLEKSGKAAAARVYPLYQKLQAKRFETENASEGAKWKPIKKEYAEYKKEKFASYPGQGTKLLIATSTLGAAVIGPGSPFGKTAQHVALFKNRSMEIMVKEGGKNKDGKPFTYPKYVAETRPFMEFSAASIKLMKEEITKFLIGG